MKINKLRYLVLVFALLLAIPTIAQRRTKSAKSTTVVQESPADKLYKSMLPSTAKIMFIDSLVVDKDSFLAHIPLNKESGSVISYNQLFKGEPTGKTSAYINEFADQVYYAQEDTVNGNALYRIDWLGTQWSKPVALNGIGDDYKNVNYPFMMADGVTLFFAAKGEKSIGGYDIFTTLYNSETGEFYQPENYGLPFNSKANDYLLAIDDLDSIGWLVSDRYQSEGKVCIYTFVPVNPRIGFEADGLSDAQLASYASIERIEDTWEFGDRNKALARIKAKDERNNRDKDPNRISFVINDKTTYTNINQFKSKKSRQLFLELNGQKASLNHKEQELEDMRVRFITASKAGKAQLKETILRMERDVENIRSTVKQMEKTVRNAENQMLK